MQFNAAREEVACVSRSTAARATCGHKRQSVWQPAVDGVLRWAGAVRPPSATRRGSPATFVASGSVLVTVAAAPLLLESLRAYTPLSEVVSVCALLAVAFRLIASGSAAYPLAPNLVASDRLDASGLHSVSVAAVVIHCGRVLAVQRKSCGRWELPGGVLERNETIEAGLVREVWEETGITVEPIANTGVYKNVGMGVISLVFLCRVKGGNAHGATPETTALRWMTLAEVVKDMRDTFPMRVLDAVAEGRPGSSGRRVVRNHNGVELRPVTHAPSSAARTRTVSRSGGREVSGGRLPDVGALGEASGRHDTEQLVV